MVTNGSQTNIMLLLEYYIKKFPLLTVTLSLDKYHAPINQQIVDLYLPSKEIRDEAKRKTLVRVTSQKGVQGWGDRTLTYSHD